jgi:hypothetical protein
MEISKIKIFVEGKDDQALIRDALKLWYKIEINESQLNELIVKTNGYTNIPLLLNDFNEVDKGNKRESGVNILIFDADETGMDDKFNHKNDEYGGFLRKTHYLEKQKSELSINFEYYLFPKNEDEGCLEDFLRGISEYQDFYTCWDEMNLCLARYSKFSLPNKKGMIYSYIDSMFLPTNNEKEKMKKYQSSKDFINNFWDLNPETNVFAAKLKSFLDNNFL